ncbi:hypothetical protein M231_05961 [Tremella mesenterica]|uniref:Uncharacterized protein n=1 Tax=Tremella mesenterica TaxID=5217 RepID=A0A4Q1BGU2_TREME|nr:hypothetical protein M231_05961 [Tremella mesenterica]
MDIDHPGPSVSSSASTSSNPHLATFVFESALPKDDYLKLIEPGGLVHRLVQRLMEKYGGEKQVRIALFIAPSEPPDIIGAFATPVTPIKKDFASPSAFLGSLPRLSNHFATGMADKLAEDSWNMFIDESQLDLDSLSGPNHAHSKRSEACLIAGVVGGLELLLRPKLPDSPTSLRQTIASLFPAGATTLLAPMLTPPSTPPIPPPRSLILVALSPVGEETMNMTPGSDSSDEVVSKRHWYTMFDGQGWTKLSDKCRVRDVDCSLILRGQSPSSGLAKTLHDFCVSASPAEDDIWFDCPSGWDVRLSGFSIDSNTAVSPSPTAVGTATDTATPSTLVDPNQNNPKTAQAKAQAAMLRFIQQNGLQNGSLTPQQAMAWRSLMAAKAGGLDMNDPAMQQFKHLLMLQQQQRQGQAAMNPAAAAAAIAAAAAAAANASATAGDASGPNISNSLQEQMLARMRLQQLQQLQQNSQSQQPLPAQPGQTNQPNQGPPTQTGRPIGAKIWSGDIVYPGGTANKSESKRYVRDGVELTDRSIIN